MVRSCLNTWTSVLVVLCATFVVPRPAVAQAVLSVSPTSVSVAASQGTNAASQTVQVRNAGKGALKWTVTQPAASWLAVSPTSGTNSGTLGLTFRTSALAAGDHQTSFRVDSTTGSAVTVTVRVSIAAAAAAPPPSEPSPTPPPDSGSFSGTTLYVSPSGNDANTGTQNSPVRTIGRGVQLAYQVNGSGQPVRVLIAAGTYRESVDLGYQKTDAHMVLEGAGATTILTGADVFSGWTQQADGSIVHAWPHKWGMKAIPNGWSNYWNWDGKGHLRDTLRRSEMVYVNGQGLHPVLSLGALTAGTFFVDETNSRLHVRLPSGLSLAGASIEVGVRPMPLRVNGARNLTLRNFAIQRSRGAVQDTAVHIANSRNVTLDGMTLRWFAYGALGTAYNTGVNVLRTVISDNGVMAYSGFRDLNVVLADSEIARNNWRGWAAAHQGWDSVQKWSGYRDSAVRRTKFSNNYGNGFWLDSDNRRITIENSLMNHNTSKGISLEKNQGPIVVSGNRVCGNAEGGITDAQSNSVTLRNNHVFNNTRWNLNFSGVYAGQTVNDWQTGESIVVRSIYWTVDGNTVAGSGSEGWLWWHTDWNAPGAWALVRNTMVLVNNNRWHHSGRTNAFTLPQGSVAHTGFVGDLVQANGNHEKNSVWQAPSGLSCTLP